MATNKLLGYIFRSHIDHGEGHWYAAPGEGAVHDVADAHVYTLEEACREIDTAPGWAGKAQGKWRAVYESS